MRVSQVCALLGNRLKAPVIFLQELHDKLTEEQHMHDLTRDQLSSAEKRASSFRAELEETKLLFDRVS